MPARVRKLRLTLHEFCNALRAKHIPKLCLLVSDCSSFRESSRRRFVRPMQPPLSELLGEERVATLHDVDAADPLAVLKVVLRNSQFNELGAFRYIYIDLLSDHNWFDKILFDECPGLMAGRRREFLLEVGLAAQVQVSVVLEVIFILST